MSERVKLSMSEYQKMWRETHPEKIQEYKERMIKWRDDNREHLREYQRRYRERNRDKLYHNMMVHKERKKLELEFYKTFYDNYFTLVNKVNDVCDEINKGRIDIYPTESLPTEVQKLSTAVEFIFTEWNRIHNRESETGVQSLSEEEPEPMLQQETVNEEDGDETEDSDKLE